MPTGRANQGQSNVVKLLYNATQAPWLTYYSQNVFQGLSIILQTHFHQTRGLTGMMKFRLFQDTRDHNT